VNSVSNFIWNHRIVWIGNDERAELGRRLGAINRGAQKWGRPADPATRRETVRNLVFVSHTCILQEEVPYGEETRSD
jgi:hypothetical protein